MGSNLASVNQMSDFDFYKLKGKTFFTVMAPSGTHKSSRTTYLGSYCTHSFVNQEGLTMNCSCVLSNDNDCLIATSMSDSNLKWIMKIIDTDYDNYLIKTTDKGIYLMVKDFKNTALIDSLISKYKIEGVFVEQS